MNKTPTLKEVLDDEEWYIESIEYWSISKKYCVKVFHENGFETEIIEEENNYKKLVKTLE